MKDKKIIEEMAKLDFAGRDVEFEYPKQRPKIVYIYLEDGDMVTENYLNDHNACIRVFNTLTTTEKCVIITMLIGEDMSTVEHISDPTNWCYAILKTKGLYDD